MITSKLASSLLVGSICLLTSKVLVADMLIQEIKNTSTITTANDLTLVFTQNLPIDGDVSITDQAKNTTKFTLAMATNSLKFGVDDLPSNFAPGATAKIKFTAP